MPEKHQHRPDVSIASHAMLEESSRHSKADKIMRLLSEYIKLAEAKVLDVGTGSGHMAYDFSKEFREVVSVDLFDERTEKRGYEFKPVKTEKLPFKDKSFDVVISNHVVEHVPDQKTHLAEAMRVLRPGGLLYLATPNKYWLTDPHYKLFFVSWLPRKISDKYVKLVHGGHKSWDIYPASPHFLTSTVEASETIKGLPSIVKSNLGSKQLGGWGHAKAVLRHFPDFILKPLQHFSPTLVYIFKK